MAQSTPANGRRGRFLVSATAVGMIASGLFASVWAATGHLLPHDRAYLRISAQQICNLLGCRVLKLMTADRVSFGGVLIAVGILYLWLVSSALRNREPWAWWTLAISGGVGLAAFVPHLSLPFVTSISGMAALALVPFFLWGLVDTRAVGAARRELHVSLELTSLHGLGRLILLLGSLGIIGSGIVIAMIGSTSVYVPQDLEYVGTSSGYMDAISVRLTPLIGQDRIALGGALVACGIAMAFATVYAAPSRGFWRALTAAAAIGFGSVIGIHEFVGYTTKSHLAPAFFGAAVFLAGSLLTFRRSWSDRLAPR